MSGLQDALALRAGQLKCDIFLIVSSHGIDNCKTAKSMAQTPGLVIFYFCRMRAREKTMKMGFFSEKLIFIGIL